MVENKSAEFIAQSQDLDQPRPFKFGLTTRTLDEGKKEKFLKAFGQYGLDDLYVKSGMSLFERTVKDEINGMIVTSSEVSGAEDGEQLAEHDEDAYCLASLLSKIHNNEVNEILSDDEIKGLINLAKLLGAKQIPYFEKIAENLAALDVPDHLSSAVSMFKGLYIERNSDQWIALLNSSKVPVSKDDTQNSFNPMWLLLLPVLAIFIKMIW